MRIKCNSIYKAFGKVFAASRRSINPGCHYSLFNRERIEKKGRQGEPDGLLKRLRGVGEDICSGEYECAELTDQDRTF